MKTEKIEAGVRKRLEQAAPKSFTDKRVVEIIRAELKKSLSKVKISDVKLYENEWVDIEINNSQSGEITLLGLNKFSTGLNKFFRVTKDDIRVEYSRSGITLVVDLVSVIDMKLIKIEG